MTTLQCAKSDAAVYWVFHRITQKTLSTCKANVTPPLNNTVIFYGEGRKEFHCNDSLRTVLYTLVETSSSGCIKDESQ